MADFTLSRQDDIGLILWDRPHSSMNTMTFEALATFEEVLREGFADETVRGLILTSAKDSFSGGMDLRALASLTQSLSAAEISARIADLHRLFRQIETGFEGVTKPVVCAINGTAMGLGVELALACHHSLAADRPEAKIGLPEVKVGLFPGGGGTTRLLRRKGLLAAAPILLEGKSFAPKEALAAGLIDAICPPEALIERAKAWIRAATPEALIKPWDRKDYRLPGGTPYSTSGSAAFIAANAYISGTAGPQALGAQALIRTAYEGALVSFEAALALEGRNFTALLLAPQVQAMIQTLFIDKQALDKGAHRPKAEAPPLRRIGVIGAGLMGAGIAALAAQRGFSVTLVDPKADDSRARALLTKAGRLGILSETDTQRAHHALTFARELGALRDCDLVIEAAPEDPQLKAEILRDLCKIIAPSALIASNTSSLSITQLAKDLPQPERVFGLHFFSPVEKMALVELIAHARTSQAAQAAGFDFARALGKTVIRAKDTPGFYANRLIIPFLHEALRLLHEGTPPALIENITRQLGFPIGPLQVLDEISLDLAEAIDEAAGRPDPEVSAILKTLLEAGRNGRKTRSGFYTYAEDGTRGPLWPGLQELFAPQNPPLPRETIEARLMLIQVLEAFRAEADGTLFDRREGNVGAVLGWGFAPWSGGPFAWAKLQGEAALKARAARLAADFGPRFTPPSPL